MHPNIARTAAALLLLAGAGVEASYPLTSKHTYCSTYYGTKYTSKCPTSRYTSTASKCSTVIVTSTPSTTVTPKPSTSTITATSTSTVTSTTQITDTETDTVTVETTTTQEAPTVTLTLPTTTTVTTTTGTSPIVSTPDGFVPIQSSVPGSSYDGQGGGPMAKRAVQRRKPAAEARAAGRGLGQRSAAGKPLGGLVLNSKGQSCPRYPSVVKCTVSATVYAKPRTSTKKATKTVTKTAATPTVTTTALTTTTTTTTSNLADAETTTTVTETTEYTVFTTPTTTVATTITETATFVVVAPTAYAQCLSQNNYADTLDGRSGVNVEEPSGSFNNFAGVTGPTNALECCNLCASGPQGSCGVSAWDYDEAICYISATCSVDWEMYSQSGNPYIFNNGCHNVRRE